MLLISHGANVDIKNNVSTPSIPIFQIQYPCISPQACFYSTMCRKETLPSFMSLIRRWRLILCFSEDSLCFTSSSLLAHRAPVVSWGWRGKGTWWDIRLCFCEKLNSPASFLSSEHPGLTERSTAFYRLFALHKLFWKFLIDSNQSTIQLTILMILKSLAFPIIRLLSSRQ